jgi:peptide/nickel transport system permease protein
MKKYIIKRILSLIPVLLIVSFVAFFIVHLTPGDPARAMLGDQATEQDIQTLRTTMGLDRPIYIQYFIWMGNIFHGNLGQSIFMNEPMTQIIRTHLGPTLALTVYSLLIAILFSIPMGILAARKRGTIADQTIMGFSMSGIAIPSFLMGLLLILLFAVKLRWLPAAGYKPLSQGIGNFIRYLTLPAISLGLMQAALITRMTRSSLLEVLNSDYIKMAKAKGVHNFWIVFKHALKNSLLPIITTIGQSFIALLSGATVTETVFNIPGAGQLVVNSVGRRDYEVIQAIILVIAVINVAVTLIMDILYGIADPRVRLEE